MSVFPSVTASITVFGFLFQDEKKEVSHIYVLYIFGHN
jgi:hypothetical protein